MESSRHIQKIAQSFRIKISIVKKFCKQNKIKNLDHFNRVISEKTKEYFALKFHKNRDYALNYHIKYNLLGMVTREILFT